MSTYGRQVLNKTGRDVMVLADLQDAQFKIGGITLAWELFAAAGADLALTDQTPIKTGEKYARFGQIFCKVTQQEVQTIDLSGDADPTGGTWDLTILGETIEGIAWNVSAAALQTLIRALSAPSAAGVTVSKAGFVYTITFPADTGNAAVVTVDSAALTSGGTVAVTIATTTQGSAYGGKYGPYDPAATDGRQTLSRGNCWINNRTVKENGIIADLQTGGASDHPQVFDGGTAWKPRILMTTGAHSLADGPTVTEFEAAFPRVAYAQ
jgi:hypothetical protein